MSWQDYIDKNLKASGHVDTAAIYGLAPGSEAAPWAVSPDFFKVKPKEEGKKGDKLTKEEFDALVGAFEPEEKEKKEKKDKESAEAKEKVKKRTAVTDKMFADGLHVAGVRYVLTKAEGRSLYARKGREGISIVQTKQAMILAHYDEKMVAGQNTTVVEALADYLIKAGF